MCSYLFCFWKDQTQHYIQWKVSRHFTLAERSERITKNHKQAAKSWGWHHYKAKWKRPEQDKTQLWRIERFKLTSANFSCWRNAKNPIKNQQIEPEKRQFWPPRQSLHTTANSRAENRHKNKVIEKGSIIPLLVTPFVEKMQKTPSKNIK